MAHELDEVIEQGNVEEYWNLGGVLTEQNYELAMSVLAAINSDEEPVKVQKMDVKRAKSMAEYAGVPLTQAQEYLYAIFEQVRVDDVTLSRFPITQARELEEADRSINSKAHETPKSLTDQRLLAEVLLLTGDMEHYEEFKVRYPNIFGKKE